MASGDRDALLRDLNAVGACPGLIAEWIDRPNSVLAKIHGERRGFDDCTRVDADGETVVDAVRRSAYDRVQTFVRDRDGTFSPVCWTNCAMLAVRRLDAEFLEYCLCDWPVYMPCELATTLEDAHVLDGYKDYSPEKRDALEAVIQVLSNHVALLGGDNHSHTCLVRHILQWHVKWLGSDLATIQAWTAEWLACKEAASCPTSVLSWAFAAGRRDVAEWVASAYEIPDSWWGEAVSDVAYAFGSVDALKFYEQQLLAHSSFGANLREAIPDGLAYADDCRVGAVREYLLSPACALRSPPLCRADGVDA